MQIPKVAVKVLVVVGVLIAGAIGVLVWQLITLQMKPRVITPAAKKSVIVSNVCKDDIVKQASPLIANNQMSALADVVTNIETFTNYQGDVNCDYILTSYYTSIGNTDKAEASLSDMKFAREAGGQDSLLFTPPIAPVESLQQGIDTQKKLQSAASNTSEGALNAEMDKIK